MPTALVAALTLYLIAGFCFLALTENTGAIRRTEREEGSVLSTHFRIVYGSNPLLFLFGRDLFLFEVNIIKEPQVKGTFCHERLIMVYPPTVKQLSIAA